MNETEEFDAEVRDNIRALARDTDVQALSRIWAREVTRHRYSYNFTWMGRPIIQIPQDMVAMQELIWQVKPDLVIETGIAHGGSLIMDASLLTLLDYSDAVTSGTPLDPCIPKRRVVGIDIDIRSHNRQAIDAHPMSHRIDMIQGSSIAPDVIAKVHAIAERFHRILVCLDSNHTHEHVRAELDAYAPMVSEGSYCIVFDTLIEQMPDGSGPRRPWGPGNNPMTAVNAFLAQLASRPVPAADGRRLAFEVDVDIDSKLLISAAPRGYLRRI